MKNEHDHSKKMMLGLLLGGVLGAGALYYLYAASHRKTPIVKKIGKTFSDIGEMLENIETGSDVVDTIQKNVPGSRCVVSNITDWVETGLSLWNKFKKG